MELGCDSEVPAYHAHKTLIYLRAALDMQRQVLVAVIATSALFVGAAYATDVGPFKPDPPEPTAEINSLTVTDRGCRGDIRSFASSKSGTSGTNVYRGVVETASPDAELTAKVALTSPENADIVTYRAVVRSIKPSNRTTTCKGEIAYRSEIDAPSGVAGKRVAVYLNGRIAHCSAGSNGPNPGCDRLYELAQKTPIASNQSTATG